MGIIKTARRQKYPASTKIAILAKIVPAKI